MLVLQTWHVAHTVTHQTPLHRACNGVAKNQVGQESIADEHQAKHQAEMQKVGSSMCQRSCHHAQPWLQKWGARQEA